MSDVKLRLLNKKHVKEFALEMAKDRAHRFTRVGGEFLLKCEGRLKDNIRTYVRQLPSKGKTIQ